MAALTAAGISKAYRGNAALSDVSFEVAEGELFCLSGPDGAGKSTLVRILAGTIKPDRGRIAILGHDGLARPEALRRAIGYMPQRFAIYADLTAEENLEFYCAFYGLDTARSRDRVEELLRLTRLERFRSFRSGNLSGGMKQKLVLGCALAHEPELLLLDEPTTGIDPLSRREFWDILAECLTQGRTIVYSSVYLEEALRANRIALMNGGRIALCDTPERLLDRARGRKKGLRMKNEEDGSRERATELLRASGAVVSVQRTGAGVEVLLADSAGAAERVVLDLAETGVSAELGPAQATLEDVILLAGRNEEKGEQ